MKMQAITNQFQFNKITDSTNLSPLREEWRKSLTAPQDDMWEAFTDFAVHWEIKEENQLIGYACVNDENCLLQFYVTPQWMDNAVSIFQLFIHQQKINKAIIGTNNPIFLSVAMHFQKSVAVDTYLFTDFLKVDTGQNEGTLRSAEVNDLEVLVDFCHVSMGGPKEWLTGYVGNLIRRGEFFVFEDRGEILGTCEVRKSDSNPKVAGVGMVVSQAHRRKGIGRFLLSKAKEISIQWNRQPICSCEKDNIGSLKSIHSNGFRNTHQMLLMEF